MNAHLRTAVLAISILGSPALAQDSEGTITGTLGLDDAVWSIAGGESEPVSYWTQGEEARTIRLVGVPRADATTPQDQLVIEFTAAGNPTEPVARDIVVSFHPAGADATFRAEGENVDLSTTAIEGEGDSLAIAGDVVATMTPGGAEGLVVDPEGPLLNFDGNFQATLIRKDEQDTLINE